MCVSVCGACVEVHRAQSGVGETERKARALESIDGRVSQPRPASAASPVCLCLALLCLMQARRKRRLRQGVPLRSASQHPSTFSVSFRAFASRAADAPARRDRRAFAILPRPYSTRRPLKVVGLPRLACAWPLAHCRFDFSREHNIRVARCDVVRAARELARSRLPAFLELFLNPRDVRSSSHLVRTSLYRTSRAV